MPNGLTGCAVNREVIFIFHVCLYFVRTVAMNTRVVRLWNTFMPVASIRQSQCCRPIAQQARFALAQCRGHGSHCP